MPETNNNSNKDNNKEVTKEDLVKSNKSMAQQNLELKDEIKNHKLHIRSLEARLVAIQDQLNTVLNTATTESNRIYKEATIQVAALSDVVDTLIKQQINQRFQSMGNIDPGTQKRLSDRFRQQEGLKPLEIDGDK